jgi:hypothetical protein
MIKIREPMETNLATACKLLVGELVLGVVLYVIAERNQLEQLWHLVPVLSINLVTAWFTVRAAKAKNLRFAHAFWIAALWPAVAMACVGILFSLDITQRFKRALDDNEA